MSYKDALTNGQAEEVKLEGRLEWLERHLNEPLHQGYAYNKEGKAVEALSLRDTLEEAAWMGKAKKAIEKRPLRQVVLPGAHDCGTWSLSSQSAYGGDLASSKALRTLSAIGLGGFTKGIVAPWAICQSQNTRNQLYHGIRYFDLRFSMVKDEFYIWHGLCGEKGSLVLKDLADFAKLFPTEILLLDLWPHHFNNFTLAHHLRFADTVVSLFGSTLCPSSTLNPWSTVKEFWNSKTNVCLIYEPPHDSLPVNHPLLPFLWSPRWLDSFWPQHVKNVDQWLSWAQDHVLARAPISPFWVLQGVITPDAGIIIKSNNLNSVQDISKVLNPRAVHFLTTLPYQDHNIVMLDFYDNCGLTQACYWANVGGQPIFADFQGFHGLGHLCHFQAISLRETSSSNVELPPRIVAFAMDFTHDWHTALLDPKAHPLPWSCVSTTLRKFPPNETPHHSSMRLFQIHGIAYAALPAPSCTYLFRFDTNTQQADRGQNQIGFVPNGWSLVTRCNAFSSAYGFSNHDPLYRSTFHVLSPTRPGAPALLVAITLVGILIASYNGSSLPCLFQWTPPLSMLETYFHKSGASPSTKERVSQRLHASLNHNSHKHKHHHGHTENTNHLVSPSSSSSTTIPSDNSKTQKNNNLDQSVAAVAISPPEAGSTAPRIPLPQVTLSPSHTAYTQLLTFELNGQTFIFGQAPVNVLYHDHAPAVYHNESVVFIVAYEDSKITLLEPSNLPPPVHRGTRAILGTSPSNDVLLGSPWFVETIDQTAYFVCRSEYGIRTWTFNGKNFEELSSGLFTAFTDVFHWNEPNFASSLRLFVLNKQLFFMGRSSAGLVLIVLENGTWKTATGVAEFTDAGGWTSEEHAKSLQVTILADTAYITGRCHYGLLTVCFNGTEWSYFGRAVVTPTPPPSPHPSIQ